MRLIPLILVIIILAVLCAWFVYMAAKGGGNKKTTRPDRSKPWAVELEDRNTTTEAWLTKGKYREYFGAIDRLGEGYADKLIDLELAAEDRARERNTARKVLDS